MQVFNDMHEQQSRRIYETHHFRWPDTGTLDYIFFNMFKQWSLFSQTHEGVKMKSSAILVQRAADRLHGRKNKNSGDVRVRNGEKLNIA